MHPGKFYLKYLCHSESLDSGLNQAVINETSLITPSNLVFWGLLDFTLFQLHFSHITEVSYANILVGVLMRTNHLYSK